MSAILAVGTQDLCVRLKPGVDPRSYPGVRRLGVPFSTVFCTNLEGGFGNWAHGAQNWISEE